ncbi:MULTISPECIES: hypothetical protein [Serratia]|uniref:Uncharacterized protein n=1 Tax=Serratia marcescens TaxID=615 RepID=A0ABD5BE49_SERMA|nr:hypothetical protein [Serratia marcescens]MDQ9395333.1 hypothetical protein [Serratia marcescens]MDQ9408016.1 hypothetical protein [Serratia marcescens]MDQ9497908.1 hypothetical protein [Serratia marcescens]MDQ9503063.1 hypothetical protein [Serratia marcescens]MDQ9508474.1 hypothetical protein [Serratia marcescens]
MPFSDMMRDNISILKANGDKREGVKASVQTGKIYIQISDFLIEPGDMIVRIMSNGGVENFEVIDPGYHEKFGGIPAGYQAKVKKLGIKEKEAFEKNVVYNITGNNNRINQHSTDNSINVVNESILQDKIKELIAEINKSELSAIEKKDSLEIIETVDAHIKSNSPSKVVVRALLDSLPKLANITSIASFIMAQIS